MTIQKLLYLAVSQATIRALMEERLYAMFREHQLLSADGLEEAVIEIVAETLRDVVKDLAA